MNRGEFTEWMGRSAASAVLPVSVGCGPDRGDGDVAAVAGAMMMDGPATMNLVFSVLRSGPRSREDGAAVRPSHGAACLPDSEGRGFARETGGSRPSSPSGWCGAHHRRTKVRDARCGACRQCVASGLSDAEEHSPRSRSSRCASTAPRPLPARAPTLPVSRNGTDSRVARPQRMFGAVTRSLLMAVVFSMAGCSEQPAPAYTRVSGPAPAILQSGTAATLVVFWATWCPPCREEVGSLRALATDPPRDLSFVTFGQDEAESVVRDYFGGEIPTELNHRIDVAHVAAGAFGVDVLPAAFLVKHGRLLARFGGPRDWNSREMRRLLERLLDERSDLRTGARPPRG